MVSFDWEVANPIIIDQRRKMVEVLEGDHP